MKLYRIVILVFCTYTIIACGGAEERKAVYLEKAKASIEAGDLDKARIELKNVLQIDPKDDEAYYQLGKVFEQLKEYRKAYANYLKAEELNPDHLLNQARLGRFYLLLANDMDKAQQKTDFILSKEPNNLDGLLLKAAIKQKKNNLNEAITIVNDVVSKDPGHIEGIAFLVSLYVKDNNIPKALNVLDNALKVNKDNKQLNVLLATLLVKNKDYERAEVIYKKILEQNPDSISSYNTLGAFYSLTDNDNKAEEIFRLSIDNDPNDVERQLILVKYIRAIKGDDEAINELDKLISKNNGLGMLRLAHGELLYLSGKKQVAIDVYKQAIKDFSEEKTGVDSRVALASIYNSDKDYVKAAEVIDEAISVSPNDPKVNFIRAKLALLNNDIETAIISLRIVTKETPENIDAYLLLVNAYQLENNEDQVRSALNSAYENNKINPDALLKLAQYYFSRDKDKSEKIIDDYIKLKESDYEGLSIKAALLNQKNEQTDAYEICETLMKSYPDKPNGYIQVIPYYGQKGDKKKAISVLEKGYLNTKGNRKILILLTTLQVSEKQFDIVEKRLKGEINAFPEDAELKIMLSKVYMTNNDLNSAESLLNEVVDNKPVMEEPYLLLSQIYQSKNDISSVKSILMKGKNNVTTSIKIPLKLAGVFEIEKDYQKAINVYRELYQSRPDNLIIINNLASMLSDFGDGDDLELAKALIEKLKNSDQSVFLDTTGWVYYKLGDYQNAIQYLTGAVVQSPNVNVFNYHLGMSYKMAGNNEQARIYLEKSLADNKQFKDKDLAEAALKDL